MCPLVVSREGPSMIPSYSFPFNEETHETELQSHAKMLGVLVGISFQFLSWAPPPIFGDIPHQLRWILPAPSCIASYWCWHVVRCQALLLARAFITNPAAWMWSVICFGNGALLKCFYGEDVRIMVPQFLGFLLVAGINWVFFRGGIFNKIRDDPPIMISFS